MNEFARQDLGAEEIEELQRQAQEADIVQLVGLKLGEEEYAIDVLKIQEIIRTVEITTVPRMDPFILGVMNIRGKVIPVIDLRVRFNLDKTDFDKATRIIVCNFDKENIGFVVDEVTEVIRIDRNMVEPTPPLVGAVGQEYILGICKYEERLIILLDIDRVISDDMDSDLRRRFLGVKDDAPSMQFNETSYNQIPAADDALDVTPEPYAAIEHMPSSDEARAEAIHDAPEEDELFEPEDLNDADDIDALIAQELAKREAETDEMNRRKKPQAEPDESAFADEDGADEDEASAGDVDNVLNDALSQAEESWESSDGMHVEQDDLDALIADELAKREAETEERNRKKREQELKERADAEAEAEMAAAMGLDDDDAVADVDDTEDAADDMAELANVSASGHDYDTMPDTGGLHTDSLDELKAVAKRIINGDIDELDIDIKGEIGELLRLIMETKNRVDEVGPSILTSQAKIPSVAQSLENVNETTEEATINLIEAADKMSNFYGDFVQKVEQMEKAAAAGDKGAFNTLSKEVHAGIAEADDLGLNFLHALEFQDITEQKMKKVIRFIEEIGGHLGTIVGFLKMRQMKTGEPKKKESSQRDIDQLLIDFGLA